MSSTNHTTHYELSQYVSSDKPTYLGDYNGDMLKIDTGINAAKTAADTAQTDATAASTAASSAQTTANTAVTNAATAQTTANGAVSSIGNLNSLQTVNKNDLVTAINELIFPAGTVLAYAGNSAPAGFLICDGSAISRTTYSKLFNIIGTTYGNGNGSTTFNIPNLKGRTVVGINSSESEFNNRGKTGGSKALQQHHHEGLFWGTPGGESEFCYTGNSTNPDMAMYDLAHQGVFPEQYNYNLTTKIFTANSGTGDSGNLQPYMALHYIIKY